LDPSGEAADGIGREHESPVIRRLRNRPCATAEGTAVKNRTQTTSDETSARIVSLLFRWHGCQLPVPGLLRRQLAKLQRATVEGVS